MEQADVAMGKRFWSRLIFGAAYDAKKTQCGLPTGKAIMARWWLTEHRPERGCTDQWECSFECACEHLGRDPGVLRARLMAESDEAIKEAHEVSLRSAMYLRRAMVLACAGIPTAIARQYLMPLVDEASYEDVAGVEKERQSALFVEA